MEPTTRDRSTLTTRTRRMIHTVLPLVGAAAAATLAAGPAAAESLSRGGPAFDSSPRTSSDTAGLHGIDPLGYMHTDSNPVWQNQHRENLRESRTPPAQSPSRATSSDSGAATWTPTARTDRSGWTVCRPQASWC
ncbi:hypothetical protein [Nocardia huaxiensis]|uniref:Uncharacterized protein n=1 Tax=Nocardia huaxiensis TaxID=2755382 RepID=A0A7D6ZHR7_9NOCA|nr:hypothetical protein [Nocardia huaxiensis]QLY30040.1 hypothetical protein H0264_33435 [Nocardia huaxiensis]UFS96362.1 hypothetical protein LPY97_38015 [Nocardia huaxiensis]